MKRLVFLFAILIAGKLSAQQNICLRYFGLTMHPMGDDLSSVQPYKLDKHAYFVANFGGFVGYERYVLRDVLAVKMLNGCFTDCAAGIAGFTHLGIRGLMFDRKGHRILLGLGPMLYVRRDWNRFPEYTDQGFFSHYHSRHFGNFQYKIFWYGAEFEYDWKISEHFDFNAGFTPGVPLALSFSAGLKYWPNRNFKGETREKLFIPKKKKRMQNEVIQNAE